MSCLKILLSDGGCNAFMHQRLDLRISLINKRGSHYVAKNSPCDSVDYSLQYFFVCVGC